MDERTANEVAPRVRLLAASPASIALCTPRSRRNRLLRLSILALAIVGLGGALSAVAQASTGAIKGIVKAPKGGGLDDVGVCALPEEGQFSCAQTTGPSGEYELSGLAPGNWRVLFTGVTCILEGCTREFAPRYYEETGSFIDSKKVVVGSTPVEEIDAQLQEGGAISGVVTAASNGSPIANLVVCTYNGSAEFFELIFELERITEPCVRTSSTGEYTIRGLETGAYTVEFTGEICTAPSCSEGPHPYETQLYNGTSDPEDATTVHVMEGADSPNIDAQMVGRSAPSATASAGGGTGQLSSSSNTPAPPGTAAVIGSSTVRQGNVTLALSCAGPGACSGTVKLLARVTEKRTVKRHGKRRTVKVTRNVAIGEATFAIAAGGHTTLSVALSGQGVSWLRKAGKKGLSVTLSGSGVQASTLVLKEKQPAKHKKR